MANGSGSFLLLSVCLACCWPATGARSSMRIVWQSAELDFDFPNETARQRALNKSYYIPGNSLPIDVDVDFRCGKKKNRIFVTIPRFDIGRPVTLGTINEDGLISGYPDYSWHDNQGSNCDGMTSVFRVAIDRCNRLWVMDAGKIGDNQTCPPQLLAFDLDTDKLIYRYKLDPSDYISTSLYITPVVDVRGQDSKCVDTFVYVADVSGFGILVHNVRNKTSLRKTSYTMYPDPSNGIFTIDGESFELMDGVLGMALSPYKPGQERLLFYHSLASVKENVVRTSVLRNLSISNPNIDRNSVYVYPGERPNQSAAEAMDSNGILYFGLMDPPGIYCWNSATEFSPRNFYPIATDKETLQFASGVKIVKNCNGQQELFVMTNSFQRFMSGSLSSNKINYRIHAESISTLLRNSGCLTPSRG